MFEYLDSDNNVIRFGVSVISIKETDNGFDLLLKQEDQGRFTVPVREPFPLYITDEYKKSSIKWFYEKVRALNGLVTYEELEGYAYRKL